MALTGCCRLRPRTDPRRAASLAGACAVAAEGTAVALATDPVTLDPNLELYGSGSADLAGGSDGTYYSAVDGSGENHVIAGSFDLGDMGGWAIVRFDADPSTAGDMMIFTEGSAAGTAIRSQLMFSGSADAFRILMRDDAGVTNQVVSSVTPVQGTAYAILWWTEGNDLFLSVNGTVDGPGDQNTLGTTTPAPPWVGAATNAIPASAGSRWEGPIQEVGWFDGAPTEAQRGEMGLDSPADWVPKGLWSGGLQAKVACHFRFGRTGGSDVRDEASTLRLACHGALLGGQARPPAADRSPARHGNWISAWGDQGGESDPFVFDLAATPRYFDDPRRVQFTSAAASGSRAGTLFAAATSWQALFSVGGEAPAADSLLLSMIGGDGSGLRLGLLATGRPFVQRLAAGGTQAALVASTKRLFGSLAMGDCSSKTAAPAQVPNPYTGAPRTKISLVPAAGVDHGFRVGQEVKFAGDANYSGTYVLSEAAPGLVRFVHTGSSSHPAPSASAVMYGTGREERTDYVDTTDINGPSGTPEKDKVEFVDPGPTLLTIERAGDTFRFYLGRDLVESIASPGFGLGPVSGTTYLGTYPGAAEPPWLADYYGIDLRQGAADADALARLQWARGVRIIRTQGEVIYRTTLDARPVLPRHWPTHCEVSWRATDADTGELISDWTDPTTGQSDAMAEGFQASFVVDNTAGVAPKRVAIDALMFPPYMVPVPGSPAAEGTALAMAPSFLGRVAVLECLDPASAGWLDFYFTFGAHPNGSPSNSGLDPDNPKEITPDAMFRTYGGERRRLNVWHLDTYSGATTGNSPLVYVGRTSDTYPFHSCKGGPTLATSYGGSGKATIRQTAMDSNRNVLRIVGCREFTLAGIDLVNGTGSGGGWICKVQEARSTHLLFRDVEFRAEAGSNCGGISSSQRTLSQGGQTFNFCRDRCTFAGQPGGTNEYAIWTFGAHHMDFGNTRCTWDWTGHNNTHHMRTGSLDRAIFAHDTNVRTLNFGVGGNNDLEDWTLRWNQYGVLITHCPYNISSNLHTPGLLFNQKVGKDVAIVASTFRVNNFMRFDGYRAARSWFRLGFEPSAQDYEGGDDPNPDEHTAHGRWSTATKASQNPTDALDYRPTAGPGGNLILPASSYPALEAPAAPAVGVDATTGESWFALAAPPVGGSGWPRIEWFRTTGGGDPERIVGWGSACGFAALAAGTHAIRAEFVDSAGNRTVGPAAEVTVPA